MSSALLQLSGAVVDLVYRIARLPEPGGEAPAASFLATAGGGFNAVAAAARLGMRAAYGGGLGTGPMAGIVRASLAAEAIPCLLPTNPLADQGTCVVLVDDQGERSFVSIGGAEGLLDDATLALLRPADYGFALLSGYTLHYAGSRAPLARLVAGLPPAVTFLFDPSPVGHLIPADILGPVLARADWVSLNEAEARALAGTTDPAPLLALAPRARGVILRAGARGARLALRDSPPAAIAPFAVAALDTTGAGDAHCAAFLAGLARGLDPLVAAREASAAGALAVTRPGPATGPSRAELDRFLAARQSGAGPARD